MVSRRNVQVEGYDVHYMVAGEGEPVILVHGLSGSTLWWTRNVPALAQHYRVYLVDLPGFGTMRRRGRFALKKAGVWLLRWMEAIGLEQAHFIGHSMGGYICLWIARQRPEVVCSLILVSPALLPERQPLLRYMKPLLFSLRYLKPQFFFILVYDALRAGFLTLLRTAQDILSQDEIEDLHAMTTPTLLVWGEGDTLVPPSLAPILRQEIPNARLLFLKKAGHVSMFDQSAAFNAAVLAFLRGEQVGK